ncbi:MAG: uroporphyrinogen decarboxylase family protein [Anaerofustis sp.]
MEATKKKEYRTKLYKDLYSGVIPDRFPVNDGLGVEFLIQYAGKDLLTTQYQYQRDLIIEILEKAMDISRGDNFSASWARNPVALMFSQNKGFVMSKSGFIQHPEISAFGADEYDQFIKSPHEFTLEKVVQRTNAGYSGSAAKMAFNFTRQYLATMDVMNAFAQANAFIQEKYGFFAPPQGSEGYTAVPFDTLADFNRGFSNISIDIKRNPQKVLDAMESLMPKAIAMQKTPVVDILGSSRIMTHMGCFLNNKDFDKFYWPTFNKLCHIAGENGQRMYIFCEGDWTRFIDNLQDLPAGARLWFEYGDAQKYKDKLGNKYILGGLYPLTLLKTGTKEECVDKAKELIDIMAPGGNYFFDFDKHTLDISDIKPENYIAVLEYCVENGKYENAGQKSINILFEDTVQKFSDQYEPFRSKYVVSFDEFLQEYPAPDERAIPFMKAAYEKYTSMVPPEIF